MCPHKRHTRLVAGTLALVRGTCALVRGTLALAKGTCALVRGTLALVKGTHALESGTCACQWHTHPLQRYKFPTGTRALLKRQTVPADTYFLCRDMRPAYTVKLRTAR
eukprot:1156248-Pelagomonas_calceolata.AAC.12